MDLTERLPNWSVERLQEALTRGVEQLEFDERDAVEAELHARGVEVPPDPEQSGFTSTIESWTLDATLQAHLQPHELDWRQRWAIEEELARCGLEPPGPESPGPPSLREALRVGYTLLGQHAGGFTRHVIVSGFAWIVVWVLFGVALSSVGGSKGLGIGSAALLPLVGLASGVIVVHFLLSCGRLALLGYRVPGPIPSRRAPRSLLLASFVVWGLAWLVFLGGTVLVGALLPVVVSVPLSAWLFASSATSAYLAQCLVIERGLTPLAALGGVAGYWRRHPLLLSGHVVAWGAVWVLLTGLTVLIPCFGGCLALLLVAWLVPYTAAGWVCTHASLSGSFPPFGQASKPWQFPGSALPRWLLPLACGLLGISVWASVGGFALVAQLTELLSFDHAGLDGWAPIAALGSVAVVPALGALALTAYARSLSMGVSLEPEGVRLDVTARWPGRHVSWERIAGFRLSEQGLRFVLRGRPWTAWTGPLVPVFEREAHELVEQLEAWGVRRFES